MCQFYSSCILTRFKSIVKQTSFTLTLVVLRRTRVFLGHYNLETVDYLIGFFNSRLSLLNSIRREQVCIRLV